MEAQSNSEQWVSVEQIAQHLNVKADTVYKWIVRKDLPAYKLGRLWKFKLPEVERWIASRNAK